MQTLIIITLWIWALALVFGLFLGVYLLGRKSAKDDLNKCWVFITNSDRTNKPIKGWLQQSTKQGRQYKYGNNTVMYPNKYKRIFYNNGLEIRLSRLGQVIANQPIVNEPELTDSEKSKLIYKIIEANIGTGVVEAVKSKKTPVNAIIIAVIALAIGAVVMFGYNQFQANQKARLQQPVTQQQQQQPENNNYQIEVK